ncbi:hypothetical protein Q3G72_013149 [Acer saccharum]|nr:hypothetical protein Q3G72_013149 [Acer saccharum]
MATAKVVVNLGSDSAPPNINVEELAQLVAQRYAYNNNQGYQQWPPQSTQPWHVPRNRNNDQPSGGHSHNNHLASNCERLTSMEGIARTMELQVEQIMGSQQQMELERLPSQTEQINALTTLRSGKVLSEPSPPEIFNVPIYVSGDSSNRYNDEELANKEAGTRKELEVVKEDTSRMHKSSDLYVPPNLIPCEQTFKETYEVLSEVDISLPLFETMTSLGETEEFDVFKSTKHLIEILECFSIQDENLEDKPHLASGYFMKSAHVELEDIPTSLVEQDSPRIEDMVTKLKEDHQVCNMLYVVWEGFGPILSSTENLATSFRVIKPARQKT